MKPFQVLGIAQDADMSEIKRAYARLLKAHRPDDDPQGFQQINHAYRQCLDAVHNNSAPVTPPDIPLPSPSAAALYDSAGSALPRHALPLSNTHPEAFHSEGVALAEQPPDRPSHIFLGQLYRQAEQSTVSGIQAWLNAQPELYSLGYKQALVPCMISHLLNHPPLPPTKLKVLLEYFQLESVSHRFSYLSTELQHLRSIADATYPGLQELHFQTRTQPQTHARFGYNWVIRLTIACTAFALMKHFAS